MPSPHKFLNLGRAAALGAIRRSGNTLESPSMLSGSKLVQETKGRWSGADQYQFLKEQLTPFFEDNFGEVPLMYPTVAKGGRFDGEPVLTILEPGWTGKLRPFGFKRLAAYEDGRWIYSFPTDPLIDYRPFLHE